MSAPKEPNLLAFGDNLDVLRRHISSESVDLVYLDPPFNSNAAYNVLFEEHGTRAAAQIKAFEDTWAWDTEAARAYQDVVEAGGPLATTLRAFRTMLGTSDMLAYLSMMAPRLAELRRVLKPTGSLYLHCDPTASHYLKLLLDGVFGPGNFRSEIVWKRSHAHNTARGYGANHDTLLFYSKTPDFAWNRVYQAYSPDYVTKHYRHVDAKGRHYKHENPTGAGVSRGATGQPWRGIDPTPKGRHWVRPPADLDKLDAAGLIHWPQKAGAWPYIKLYFDSVKGIPAQDFWADIDPINMMAKERLPYPTQKPLALLRRIVEASSSPGDIILDPFCGCGTTVEAAQELDRRWIGIDITHHATALIKSRLREAYGPGIAATYRVIGEPTTVEDAAVLARTDPYQFQSWALGLLGARPAGPTKKGGDRGIDGRLFFHDVQGGPTRQIVISVKAGHLVPAYVRDLVGVVSREEADIGALISFEEPTSGMRAEAASAEFMDTVTGRFPRIQLRTVGDLLAGRGLAYPTPVEPPTTLWPEDSLPPREKRKRRRVPPPTVYVPASTSPVAFPLEAAEVRARYANAGDEAVGPSREAPQSPRKSKRDRTAPLPSPGSSESG